MAPLWGSGLWRAMSRKLLEAASAWALTASVRLQVRETVRDVQFLHNEQYFAAAQKKYVYIYDKRGLEVHCLKVGASVAQYPRASPCISMHLIFYIDI